MVPTDHNCKAITKTLHTTGPGLRTGPDPPRYRGFYEEYKRMALRKLSGIVNGFMVKRLLLPLVGFVVVFSSLWVSVEIKDLKARQLYYAENLAQHMIVYLANCSENLAHFLDHITDSPRKYIDPKELIGFESLFHAIYLVNDRGRVIKSMDEAYFNQDFSGIINHGKKGDLFSLTAPYYSDFAKKIVVGMTMVSGKDRVIFAELNLASMEQHINGITRFLKNGSVFLTDPFGNIIADINMDLVKQQENYGNLAVIKALRKQTRVSDFFYCFGRLKFMSGTMIHPGNIKIVVHQDAWDILRPVLWSTLFSLFLLCILAYFIIAKFNSRLRESVVHPIATFAKEIEHFRSASGWQPVSGDLPPSTEEEFRELFDLRAKFREMQETIVTREADLKQSEERYRGVVEDTPVLICRFRKTGEITFANRACHDHFDSLTEHLIGSDLFSLFLPFDKNRIRKDLDLLSPLHPTKTSEYRILDAEGKIRWYAWTNRALFQQSENTITFHCTAEEITKRKEDEEKLAAERERLAVTLRSIGDGVITTDMDGRVVILNRVAEALTGWKQEEAAGRPLSTVFHIINETTGAPHESPVEKVLASGEIVELENHTILISKDGQKRVIADSGAPIKDQKSRTIGVVLVFRDMTEKQKYQETLQRTAKIESLGVLAGGIAHDFNNLLGGIYGYIDLAAAHTTEEKATILLKKAIDSIERARNLSGQLLTFSKGGTPIKKIAPLFPFVKQCVEFALSGSNIAVTYEITEDLMACNYDRNQIGQVIDNIVINAKQAMSGGGKMAVVAENLAFSSADHPILRPGEYIRLSFRDSGSGIPQHIQDKIFDPFFSTKEKGHGIGLTTSYSIIEKHGGCIEVASAFEEGTTFFIFLPAIIPASVIPKPEPALATAHQGKGRILIMDDEQVIVDITSKMLEILGYESVARNDGQKALELFQKEKEAGNNFAAILCDLTIPGGMGGLALVKEIRKTDPDIPVFVSSGYSGDPIMHDPEQFGFTASISKPFRRAELAEFLARHL